MQDRRELFRSLFSGLGSAFKSKAPARIRPPGALPEDEFLATCQRCRACVDACPEFCIIPAQEHMEPPTGTPFLIPDRAPCTLCGKCMEACPSGALRPIAREAVRMARARVRLEVCRKRQPGCDSCVRVCPVAAQAIALDALGDPQILDGCTGCGQCALACPTGAILVEAGRN